MFIVAKCYQEKLLFFEPTDYGCIVEENKLKLLWYVSNPTLMVVEDILLSNEDDKSYQDTDESSVNAGPDSDAEFESDF